jgi:hypothetical protein
MALTLRTNGTGGGIVSAAWWNDYYNLLTGVMTDQAITLANTLTAQHLMVSGTGVLGRTTAGDILDTDSNAALYLKAASGQAIHFQIPNGTDILQLLAGSGTLFKTLQSGAANGFTFQTWTGTANAGPLSIGGQFNGAASYVDAGGVYTVAPVSSGVNWTWAFRVKPTGNTVDKDWLLLHDGGTGNLFFYDNTDAKTVLVMKPDTSVWFANNLANVDSAGHFWDNGNPVTNNRSAGGGSAGRTVWVGTTDPGASAGEGDIWIDA